MRIKTITVGPFAMNCYVAACEETRQAVVIDPGDELDRILAAVRSLDAAVQAILLTHAHLDHIGAVGRLQRQFPVDIYLHSGDLSLYDGLPEQGHRFGLDLEPPPPVSQLLSDGQEIALGNTRFRVLHTPGHSPGGVSFLAGDTVFVGDALFAGSIGRTDLPGGSYPLLIESIRSRLLTLDEKTKVYPGHGPPTTIGEELRSNPFLQPGFSLEG